MFRVKESDADRGVVLLGWVMQLTLLLALAATCASGYLILREYGFLETWREGREPPEETTPEDLQGRVRVQLGCMLTVATILTLGMAAIWRLRRRYFFSQHSLRQVKMLAHDILASMDQGVITTDRQGTVTSINSAGIRLLGVDFECVGRPLNCLSTPDIPLVELAREGFQRRTSGQERDFTVNRAGIRRRLRGDAHVLTDTRGVTVGCVIHLRDVTERVLLEERMRRMERFISLGALASGLHHEIKNPLTALSIHIQLLEERLADSSPGGVAAHAVEELVRILKTEVVRLNGVLESFRNFANLRRLSLNPTDVLEVLDNAVRLVAPQAAQQQVRVRLLPPEGDLPAVPLDADKFEQAVLNLMINALEAMPSGGILTLAAAMRDGSLRVEVTDTGPGIPEEIQKNLFEPYFSTKGTGTGMGLALSEKLISQHGGHIDYTTGARGTTFSITIPAEHKEHA
jgi:PAS domain S-box-containing protein